MYLLIKNYVLISGYSFVIKIEGNYLNINKYLFFY